MQGWGRQGGSERARCTLGNHEMKAVFGALHDVWDESKLPSRPDVGRAQSTHT